MKTTFLLKDEPIRPRQLLQERVPTKLPLRKSEAVAGCNCDRWGHPCPGCSERNTQPKAELPVSVTDQEMR